jgi:hypothetical protein
MGSIADYDGDGLADILWVSSDRKLCQWQSNEGQGPVASVLAALVGVIAIVLILALNRRHLDGLAHAG